MENPDTRNLILAMLISMAIMFGWLYFFGPDPEELEAEQASAVAGAEENEQTALVARDDALSRDERVVIDTPRLGGSINLKGGRIDDLTLKDYRESMDDGAPAVKLLSPQDTGMAYFVQTGFAPKAGLDKAELPATNSVWRVKSGDMLAPGKAVVLEWTSPGGVGFEREIGVDDEYMFTIRERITNNSGAAIELQPYAYVSYLGEDSRISPVPIDKRSQSGFILHQGAIRNIDGVIDSAKFKEMREADTPNEPGEHVIHDSVSEKGWIGLTTKYWMVVLAPEAERRFLSLLRYVEQRDVFTAESYFESAKIASGASYESKLGVYAGAKEVEVIRRYRDEAALDRFDDTVDWGRLYFLTKPIFSVLHWLYSVIGNMGLAIIALTFVIKSVLFPLAHKSFVSMSRMKKLQPEMEKIKEAAGDDRMKMQQMTMELYRKEKVSPVSGCLPILLQIPIFFALYKVLYVTTELRHASFFGPWQDLSAPDPTSIWNLFGLLPWGSPSPASFLFIFALGILPILLGISMFMTQRLNPTPTDKTQAMIFNWMPWIFMLMMGSFASGLLVYWITNNVLTFAQQYTIMRSQGVRPDIFGNIRGKNRA